MIPSAFHRSLRTWFRKSGRDLPWRRNRDPYAVLVSEFMLQQTTVTAVVPYFERWMRAFPDVCSLARAEERDVLAHWQGLGYYSRGRRLLRAAREIVARFGGKVPRRISELLSLPGVGPYTAAAIAAFAFDECVPVLDANIIRVVARLNDFNKPVASSAAKALLEQFARQLLPASGGCLHTSALMDLGATVCKAGGPDCAACPLEKFCRAKAPEKIPVKAKKKMVIRERDARGFARSKNNIYLVPSPGPRWRGLWVLPPVASGGRVLWESTFTVTRHRIRMQVSRARPRKSWMAFCIDHLPPMPSPHARAAASLLAREQKACI